ncbi:hypothetical protein ACIBBG_16300 [Micromonospora chersina]|uniref:hypothetical protein n=1 Tax=Micromonospora chersina TaxID=47854 RepID=UPI00378CD3D1
MLVGWCPGGRPVDAMLKTYERTGVARIFVSAGKPMPAWDGPVLGPLVAAGVAVHLSYKTNPLSEVLAWVARKPAGVLLFLSEDHEPEQGPDAGDPTLEEYHASQAALVAAFDGHPMRDEIWLGPVFTRYWWQKVAGDRRWWPRVLVDFIAWDVYSDVGYRTPGDLLTIPRAVAAETGVPYLIAELGAKPGAGRAAWMRAMVDAAADDGALTVCWFHKDGWDLTGSPDQQTWQTIIREETPVATTAPQTLLDARQLLLTYLNVDKDAVRGQDLEPAEVGIVGDPNHKGGYHCGSDRVVSNDYSVVESSRDRTGLDRWACALDVGEFAVSVAGKRHDLPSFSIWLVAQCKAGTADTRDIREVIYSPDGTTVKRWDRLGKRTSGDETHRWHTHISFHRDAIKAGRDQTPLFRRYLTTIGLIESEDDMSAKAEEQINNLYSAVFYGGSSMGRSVDPDGSGGRSASNAIVAKLDYLLQQVDTLTAQGQAEVKRDADLRALVERGGIDPAALAQQIAEHLPADDAKRVVDELAARLAS